MLRTAVALAIGLAGASIQQATNSADDVARQQDVYAVYSAMMSNPPTDGFSFNAYPIAAMTIPVNLDIAAIQGVSDYFNSLRATCNAPPPGYEDRWPEILSDFRSRGDASVALQRELKITKPYLYLNEKGVVVMDSRTPAYAPISPNSQFGATLAVFRLGNVFFSKDHSLAVSYISLSCGSLCGLGERKVFERTPNGWKAVMNGTHCTVSS